MSENTISNIELLAPAGSMEAFYAAIHNGADAVYLGARAFGARSSAGFDDQALQSAVRYAHLYGRKVYVTLNILMKQSEISQITEILRFLDAAKVDAVIVQDLGLMHFIRRTLPHLPVHASTQMSIHNASGAQLMRQYGLTRVVLARECSLETIRSVTATGIETEVFVHGAQCVSVSGQCLLSSHIGGRSGNRGRCAQPCRTQFSYRGKEGAWLSPRDLAQLDRLEDLVSAGVSSLKIEGRLKRPEYVATVTRVYRQALDRCLNGTPSHALPVERKALLQIFNRGGFTEGWAFGKADALQINPARVSHEGLPLGKIRAVNRRNGFWLAQIQLNDTLHNEDHLQVRGMQEQEMIYSGPEVPQGGAATLRLHQDARAGDSVYRLTDASQLAEAKKSYESAMPPIPFDIKLRLTPGKPSVLSLSKEKLRLTVEGETAQSAVSRPLDREAALKAIQKTGDSPFGVRSFDFECSAPCFMPVSALNALRREALDRMKELMISSYSRPESTPYSPTIRPTYSVPVSEKDGEIYVRGSSLHLIDELRRLGMNHFLFTPQDYTQDSLALDCHQLCPQDYFCLPRQLSDKTLHFLTRMIKENHLSVMADNIGQLNESYPAALLAGPGIPCWNSETADFLMQRGCSAAILSTELSKTDIECLVSAARLKTILPVYGRAMVMQLNHCPERTFRGLTGSQTACRLCQAGEGTLGRHLEDRMGARFPLFPTRLPEGCLNTLLFHTPVNLGAKAVGNNWLLDFAVEDDQTIIETVAAYASLLRGNSKQLFNSPAPLYAGRFDEGVL